MKRVTVDMAAQATGLFDVHRFRQHTKKERESAWHAFRALGVGGSDMSTILGLNPYSTPYDLWLEKTNRQQPEDISGKWAIVKGNALEVELRRRFRQMHPEWTVIDGTDISLVSKQHPLMHASLDGFVYDEESDSWGILEIKTANANRGRTDWHDETGELIAPDYYLAQVTHYMAVTGFRWGYFYADIGEAEPSPVDVKRAEMIRRFQALGVASDAEACETITKILNREVKASDELTEAELDKVLGQLKASVKEGE